MIKLNKNNKLVLCNIINTILGGYNNPLYDSSFYKNWTPILLNKIEKWYNDDNEKIFTKEEFEIIKNCVESTLKYLDEDDYETIIGGSMKEIYDLKDLIINISLD